METRTERLLRVLGNREAFAVVRALLTAELTMSGLSDATKLSPQTLDRTLETLSQGSVVSRRPGTQGAWYLVYWPETFAVLDASRRLSVAIAGSEEHLDRAEAEMFMRLDEAGGAVAAARRGRQRGAGA